MKHILDSSVAFKWGVTEADSDKAQRLRDESKRGLLELHSPDVFPVELAHSMTRAERQGRVSTSQGLGIWLGIMADAPVLHPDLPLLPRAYSISSALRIGLYDCLYVALAEVEGCELITADMRLITNLQSRFPFIVPLSDFP